ncbi:transglutaminase domain-containing protein [Microbacterium enclense]|uniref:transglutaminase domain-containing protein n=1 Tax=Microbacterium enclense TaxID=993073 RepID=UPI003F7FFA2F
MTDPKASADQGGFPLEETVSALARVPSRYRAYDTDTLTALKRYGFTPGQLSALLDHGLPHLGTAHEPRFDRLDLENAALGIGIRTPRRTALRWWRRALQRDGLTNTSTRIWYLRVEPTEEGRGFAVRHTLSSDAAGASESAEDHNGVFKLTVRTSARTHTFDARYDSLFSYAAGLRFHLLPEPLQDDVGFAKETGLADCKLAATVMTQQALARGIEARSSAGRVLTGPYATWHAWFDIRVADEWIVADPFFLGNLHRWGVLSPEEWAILDSPGVVYWRTGEDYSPILRRGSVGVADRVSIVRSPLSEDPASPTPQRSG